jgi:hypothetical protein
MFRGLARIWGAIPFRTPLVALAILLLAIVAIAGVEAPPEQQSAVYAPHNGSKQETRETPDDRLANYTWWLTVFTGLLAAVSTFQIAFLTRADKTARLAAESAQRSADAAFVSERAWIVMSIDSDNIEESVLQLLDQDSWPALLAEGLPKPTVKYHITNLGKTPAFIRETSAALICSGKSVPIPEYQPLAPWWPEESILAANERLPELRDENGKEQFWQTTMLRDFTPELARPFDVDIADGQFWFYGRVVYADVWGAIHETKYCWANEAWSSWYIPPDATKHNERT